jgi:aspartate/methionine/tyrosine aminotransferase
LQSYPFEKLRALFADVKPNAAHSPIALHIGEPKHSTPEGGFYFWVRTPIEDTVFARELYAAYNVSVLPGSYLARDAHGDNPGRNHVRLALVAPRDECVEAARRLADFAKRI